MAEDTKYNNLSADPAVHQLLPKAKKDGVKTAWDRYDEMQTQCGFGQLGICCRICLMGPCRIDPFGEGAQKGICGATPDLMVARNLARMIAGGAAAHSDHARHVALTMLEVAKGHAPAYSIKDETKLKAVAQRIGLDIEGKTIREIAKEVVLSALEDFSRQDVKVPCTWAATTVTKGRMDTFAKLGVVPHNIDAVICETMHRTTMGVDSDAVNVLLGAIKCALADYAGMYIASDLSDILFGTPTPVVTEANLGVLEEDAVNIAVHGHNPVLCEVVCDVAAEMDARAKEAGAKAGINMVGICCSGNEVMMRRGVPLATNSLSQGLAISTGVMDAVVVDVQCIYPALGQLAECYHTKIITTSPIAKMPGAVHIEFHEDTAKESAEKIIETAIEAFKNRDSKKILIPNVKNKAFAGFSTEAIVAALAKLYPNDPLKPLVDNIANGNILGICLFAGCNNPKTPQDESFLTIAKELARNNVLIVATGCGAGAFAKAGLLTPEATNEYAGDTLKAVLTAIGEAAGLGGPLPLVLHMGSCVDNPRAVTIAVAVANELGVDIDKLPVVASAPEAMHEKAVSIGTGAMALGLPVHLGVVPPILGSNNVTEVLTSTVKGLVGGYFFVETNPLSAAAKIIEAMKERRKALGI
jgi:carbon-monoxide dehydrogenase catalytic subunit